MNAYFVAPSVTTYPYRNPTYRIYSIDGRRQENSSWQVVNHETYVLNMSRANLYNETRWIKEYDMKVGGLNSYCIFSYHA